MKDAEVLLRSRKILAHAGLEGPTVSVPNFLDFAELVRDAILQWPEKIRIKAFWLEDFAESLRRMRDNFEDLVQADPMLLYVPAHKVAEEFHKSRARFRYFRSGNGCSKTQSSVFDNYAVATGQMLYRPQGMLPANIFIVGMNFSKYGQAVFEKKYIIGESINPLSPAFPEGGKWFNHYDSRKYILTIACPECAEAKRARECKHATRSTIQLFSDMEGPEVLAGGQFIQGQFDEEISEEFLQESVQRFRGNPLASLMITGTPLSGKGSWEHKELTLRYLKGGSANIAEGTTRPLVSIHTISQYDAGLKDHNVIRDEERMMSKAEAQARIYGLPAAFTKTGVFNAFALQEMHDEILVPTKGKLFIVPKCTPEEEVSAEDLLMNWSPDTMEILFQEQPELEDGFSMWEEPQPHSQYVIGADVAQGLITGDYSAAVVMKITRKGTWFHWEQVAGFRAHINAHDYGDELMKMSLLYNEALIVVERRGPGDMTLHRLTFELIYGHRCFRDLTDPSQAHGTIHSLYGIDTNVKSKGIIVSALQKAVSSPDTGNRSLIIRDEYILEEMGHFGQDKTATGLSLRFRGQGGMHDDCVIAVAMSVYSVISFPEIYDFEEAIKQRAMRELADKELTPEAREFWSSFRHDDEDRERLMKEEE